MIYFFTGFAVGVVTALVSAYCLHKASAKAETNTEPTPEEKRLNAEKKQREERLAELNRQFDNMMNYKGEDQRK